MMFVFFFSSLLFSVYRLYHIINIILSAYFRTERHGPVMKQPIQSGSLLCNLLITWAILRKPSMPSPGQLLSLPPPQNKNKWVHPVIFEPQPMI